MERVIVVDYDPEWPRIFETLCAPIVKSLEGLSFEIEHIGSTAVPGLAAKPIIDLDVIVPAAGDVSDAIERLAVLGYRHRGDLGIGGREAFDPPAGLPAHHLYVCVRGCLAVINHLGLRDYLRARPEAAAAYAQLKRRLAGAHAGDIDGYIEGKSSFLSGVLGEIGLSRAQLEAIEAVNRRPSD